MNYGNHRWTVRLNLLIYPMPTISGKALFDAVVIDVRTFFPQRLNFDVKVEYGGMNPCCKGVGSNTRICLPSEFQTLKISTAADLHFWLIVLGHEIAHYLNRHNDFNKLTQESMLETRAIEDWADFFGMKLVMTIITFGPMIGPFYKFYSENIHYETRLESMANAFGNLANSFYNTKSNRYSTRSTRVGNCVAGICSFLDRLHGGLDVERSFSVMKKFYFSAGLSLIIKTEPMCFPEDISTTAEVHQAIQGVAPAITDGLSEFLVPFIGTTFSSTPEERIRYVAFMRAEAVRQGVQFELSPDESGKRS